MIKFIRLANFLSFGENQEAVELRPLNIVIGANGCGKSNFLEAFDLLRNAPKDIKLPIREGGGVLEWLYKDAAGNDKQRVAALETTIDTSVDKNVRYELLFTAMGTRFEIIGEQMINAQTQDGQKSSFSLEGPVQELTNIFGDSSIEVLSDEQCRQVSMLSEISDKKMYPEIVALSHAFNHIHLYRDWVFGRNSACRQLQNADMPCEYLAFDCSNLALVLNQMNHHIPAKRRLLTELQNFYADVEDYFVSAIGNYVQIYFQERGRNKPIPASRLSDGTLRYLCLLAILCNPNPPPLVCIEEPELGLHPDIIPGLARLMTEASEKCQLIVTTHSDILIDAFTENPEAILVAEKIDGETQIKRLNSEQLAPWLAEYRLGSLWLRGDIGGTRW